MGRHHLRGVSFRVCALDIHVIYKIIYVPYPKKVHTILGKLMQVQNLRFYL